MVKADRKVLRKWNCGIRSPYFCRWALSEETWPFKYYVPFAQGMGALYSQAAVKILIEKYRHVSPILIDDVYVAYILKRNKINVCALNNNGITVYPKSYKKLCQLQKIFIQHFRGQLWPAKLHNDTMYSWKYCKRNYDILNDIAKCYPNAVSYKLNFNGHISHTRGFRSRSRGQRGGYNQGRSHSRGRGNQRGRSTSRARGGGVFRGNNFKGNNNNNINNNNSVNFLGQRPNQHPRR